MGRYASESIAEKYMALNRVSFLSFLREFEEQNREKIIEAISYEKEHAISTEEELSEEVDIETTTETVEEEIEL